MEAINPDLREMQRKYEYLLEKYAELSAAISKTQGEVSEIKRVSTSFSQQTIWQLLGFAIVMASVMITGIYYQTNALRNEFNPRIESLERQMNLRFEAQQQQIIQLEKSLNARFEDLKQEMRASRRSGVTFDRSERRAAPAPYKTFYSSPPPPARLQPRSARRLRRLPAPGRESSPLT